MSTATASRAETRAFEPHEVLLSIAFSTGIIISFFMLLVVAGENSARVKAEEAPVPTAIPIRVNPVLDDVPLLKAGGATTKKVRPKLPDMWKKKPPVVKRAEATSAPSPKAAKTPEAAPKTKLAKPDAPPPPPEEEAAKEVEQAETEKAPEVSSAETQGTVEGEGTADGVLEGTETNATRAYVQATYMRKIANFLNGRFQAPTPDEASVDCASAKALRASASVTIGSGRQITGYTIAGQSGNAVFDARVKSTLESLVGEDLPPPPDEYPDFLDGKTSLVANYSGSGLKCQ